jgi:hypothetical protein
MGQNGQPLPQQAQPQMPPQSSGLPTTPGLNGQPVYTGGYDPNSPLYQPGVGAFGGAQIGQRETGPPPGMSQEAWQQGEDYLNGLTQAHTNIFGQQVPGTPRGSGTLASLQPQKDSFGMKSGMDPNMTLGGWGKPTGQMGTFGSLSSLGNTLGSAGGNVLKKLF